jgi:hypothetical protein
MVSEEVEAHHGEEDEHARRQNPRVAGNALYILRIGEEVSPASARLLNAESEER